MILHLTVKPGSKVDRLFYDAAGKLNAKIRALTQDGKGNAYLIGFQTDQLGLAKSNVTIVAGFNNQRKRIDLNISEDDYI